MHPEGVSMSSSFTLESLAAQLLHAEHSVAADAVDTLLSPPQSGVLHSSDERAELHDKLVARGLQANRDGASAKAAALFWDAWRLDQRKLSTLISHLNMRLKMGDLGVASAAYLRLLEDVVLSDRDWQMVQTKLQEANRLLVERKARLHAVLRLQRAARARLARRLAARLTAEHAAARVLQRRFLRARLLPALVDYVVLLRLAPPAAATSHDGGGSSSDDLRTASAADVLAAVVGRRGNCGVEPRAVAPFAALCLPDGGCGTPLAPLHFVVTSKHADVLHACALAVFPHDGASPLRRECLVLLSRSYLPRALAACAHALLPLACRASDDGGGGDGSGGGGGGDDDGSGGGGAGGGAGGVAGGGAGAAAALAAFRTAARQLVTQPAPRAGEEGELVCADTRVAVRQPRVAPQPEAVESCSDALAPLSSAAICDLLSALLVEQKVVIVSSRVERLTAAAQAATSLLFPLRWSQVYVPLLPRSHLSVAGAPFPFLLGLPTQLLPSLGRAAPGVGSTGELWVLLDEGRTEGRPLATLPLREDGLLRARLRSAPLGGRGGRGGGRGGGGGAALRGACLAAVASLLRDAPPLAMPMRDAAGVAGLGGAELDAAVAQLAEQFVQCQPPYAQPFARLLCETSALRILLEALLQPRHRWHGWLLHFERATAEARQRG